MARKTRKVFRRAYRGGNVGEDKCPVILASIPETVTFERVDYSPEIAALPNIDLPKEKDEFYYYALSAIPQAVQNSLKENSNLASQEKKQNLSLPRRMSYAKYRGYGHTIAKNMIDKVNKRLQELQQPLLKKQTVYDLEWLKNSELVSIAKNTKKGTILTEENIQAHLTPTSYTGNQKIINLTKPLHLGGPKRFFLKRGLGEKVLCYSLRDLKERGATAVILVCMNHDLKPFYEKYGFQEIDKIPYMPEFGLKNVYYGDPMSDSGPVMFKRL